MAKKKNKSSGVDNPILDIPLTTPSKANSDSKRAAALPSTSALIICRNKHWRYISSFHGPWLQLPPEVLENLANYNYNQSRPRPIDPAVFFDLLKVRKLVDEATSLAVRAASGVTSSQLNNSLNAGNGLMGNGGSALGLGLGGGGGGNAKLSRERKHRMREQATQKLSKAYHLDEIACSVATMQSTTSLEDVAQLVLQRSPDDPDAKYVHFFHEKIPSRQLAECTSLEPLDQVIADRPRSGEPLRTRAVTRIFKEDYVGAAKDLTEALSVCRYYQGQHKAGRQQLQLASAASDTQRNSRWREESKLDEEDHPSSLEPQILFHRAGVYLTIACQHVDAALPPRDASKGEPKSPSMSPEDDSETAHPEMTPVEKTAHLKRLEARKIVKTNAKKALRDYVAYLSHLDYTPALPNDIAEEFVRKVNQVANGFKIPRPQYHSNNILDVESNASLSNGQLSDALVPHNSAYSKRSRTPNGSRNPDLPNPPPPIVYPMSMLFSSTPPTDLPPYPSTSLALTTKQKANQKPSQEAMPGTPEQPREDCHEAITYHPLLTDALHSLLLCHCLIQTSSKELQRHAHMVARLARTCDGWPIFQAARSPSRSDWIEVLRRNDNWIGLSTSWETLCMPSPLPGQGGAGTGNGGGVNAQKETTEQKRERLKQQAIMEALEDDRVHDEASFHAAVKARQARQEEDARRANGDGAAAAGAGGNAGVSKRWAQEDGKEYPISTDRAQAIVRWIREAPLGGEGSGARRKKKGKPNSKGKGHADIEEQMADLKMDNGDEYEVVEEEVD